MNDIPNEFPSADEVLNELRHILRVPQGECIIEHARLVRALADNTLTQ